MEAKGEPTVQPEGGLSFDWRESAADPEWDAFLAGAGGEHLQTALWAQGKQGEGWHAGRALLMQDGSIAAGFQVLHRRTRIGRIGYVSRGPVFAGGEPALRLRMAAELRAAARRLKVRMLIVQGSQRDALFEAELQQLGFLPNRIHQIITATWLFPLGTPDRAAAPVVSPKKKLKSQEPNPGESYGLHWRRIRGVNFRQAVRKGVVVEEGSAGDVAAFFDLMAATCRRQKVGPSPASAERLLAAWQPFRDAGRGRLTFAIHEGRRVAGLLCLWVGPRKVYIWKKGCHDDALGLHPMEPLYHEVFSWAHARGFEVVDHCGVRRSTAEMVLQNAPLTEEIKTSRDFYHMGFGGGPELLPEAMIWIPNQLLRAAYRVCACGSWGTSLLRRRYEC